jgi:uncharacterized membrane protein
MFSKHRIEALSDAVIAIAMTLLVLEIKAPPADVPGGLGYALLHDAHEWISFVVSFALASVFWSIQHRVFDEMEEMDTVSLVLTFAFLGFVTVLPFTTAVWGHHIKDPVAHTIYFCNQFLIALLLLLKLERARIKGHLRDGVESDSLRLRLLFMCLLMGSAAVATQLVQINHVWWFLVPLALIARYMRHLQKRKATALAEAKTPELP